MMLPGSTPVETEAEKIAQMSPQYQRYLQAANNGGTRSTGLTTTTIRRRINTPGSQAIPTKPAIDIPEFQQFRSQIAAGGQTPSLSIDMLQQPSQSNVLPVSAQAPAPRR